MSSAGTVDLQFSASDRAAVAAWQSQQKLADLLIRKMEKLEQVSRRTSESFNFKNTGIGGAVADMGKLVASMASIYTVVRQIKVEYEAILQERKGASDVQIGFFRAMSNALRNSGGLFADANGQNAARNTEKFVMEIARASNQSPTKVAELLDSFLSAQGVTKKSEAEALKPTMIEVLKTYPDLSVEDTKIVGGAVQDVISKTGMTANEAIGYALKVGQSARVVEPLNQAKNLLSPSANMMDFGLSIEESGALLSTFTQGLKDYEGANARTAALVFVRELEERFPKAKGYNTFAERLEKLRQNPKYQEAFFQGGMIDGVKYDKAETGKGLAVPTLRQLFDPNSLDSKRFVDTLKDFGTREDLKATAEKQKREIQELKGATVEAIQRTGKTVQENIRLENQKGAVGSVSEEAAKEIMTAAGIPQVESDAAILKMRVAGDTPRKQAEALSKELKQRAEIARSDNRGDIEGGPISGTLKGLSFVPITGTLEGLSFVMQWITGTLKTREQLNKEAEQFDAAAKEIQKLSEQLPDKEPEPVALSPRREIDPGQVAFWEQKRQEFRDPNHMFRKTKVNPWYNRAKRYPEENKAILEGQRIEAEIGARLEMFGSLSEEDQKRLGGSLDSLQKRGNKLGLSVHTYDLQLMLDRLNKAVFGGADQGTRQRIIFGGEDRESGTEQRFTIDKNVQPAPQSSPKKTAPANSETTSEAPKEKRQVSLGEQSSRTTLTATSGVGISSEIVSAMNRLSDALERNTQSTNGNTLASSKTEASRDVQPEYRPTTLGQQRGVS